MRITFILALLFIAFGLYNWFFILKDMTKEVYKRTIKRTIIVLALAFMILLTFMAANNISGF